MKVSYTPPRLLFYRVKESAEITKVPVDYDLIKKEVIQVWHTESCLLKSTAEVENPQVNTPETRHLGTRTGLVALELSLSIRAQEDTERKQPSAGQGRSLPQHYVSTLISDFLLSDLWENTFLLKPPSPGILRQPTLVRSLGLTSWGKFSSGWPFLKEGAERKTAPTGQGTWQGTTAASLQLTASQN